MTIENNLPLNQDYQPSVPKGFSNTYALTANDVVGKMFAWQYTATGRFPTITSNIDLNLTALPKDELFKLLVIQQISDRPHPPPTTSAELTEILEKLASLDANTAEIELLLLKNKASVSEIRTMIETIQSRL